MAKDTMQEVQVSESTSVVLPSLKDMKVTGFENVTMDDTATPFLIRLPSSCTNHLKVF